MTQPALRLAYPNMANSDPPPWRPTILLADDEPAILALLVELLQPEYRVRVATSGTRALELAAGPIPPDLILLDVVMPAPDGYETFASLQANSRTREIPVIFVTALDAIEDEERGLELGARDYITKPLRAKVVRARVRTQLELKRAQDHLRNQNTYLEAEVQRRLRENQVIENLSIHALARLADTRDPETGNHLRRTQEYVHALAQQLQAHPRFASFLTDRNIELLVKSAPLHDIGKVGIPDHILLKPGPLTAEEWAVMRTHAKLGSDAIEQAERDAEQPPVAFLRFAKEIARWHHERWDGSGYPDGLAGEAIPISARLMALADVFDALTMRRVYKERMDHVDARTLLAAERGRQFDPDVVDAFLQVEGRFLEIAAHWRDIRRDEGT